ncbi:MurR/RpiR family transcriptional regulator [Geosporobacter ferrireducens]|uniref:N-acetylmannosamine kinase n=1 Tax=Geosporobacter ferrireducens TaxID=1424294 RepID=A0A1D8GB17_9FIRM|nr:MurR/RpiR family transcriptional regulator [Geosporobacter ferrireducens]AOT68109.1 N-acetylmannosamine kinase [Geosporobacter ferrireducens]MTI54155.1 MurR/RpiR family transcriptional regulator [Geosporobacter ferrireducens]
MNDEHKDLIRTIQKIYPRLSKGQKLIAEFISNNYDKAAFMTASKLGIKVGVSESTVVRFANTLGYDGYPKLQRELQELIKTKLTTVQRLEMSKDYSNESAVLKKVLKADMDNIRATIEEIDAEVFQKVVNSIFDAKRIYILGLRSSTTLAEYLGFYLNLIHDNVKVVTSGVSDIFEQMIRVGKEDLVIGISFPRYSTNTLNALKYTKDQGALVVGITDSQVSPIASIADYTLTARSHMATFVDSLVAPLSLINALVVAVGMREKDEITSTFDALEKIWEKHNIYNGKK